MRTRSEIALLRLRLQHSARLGPAYFHGETMRPFLGEGDLVVVEPVTWEDIRPGDIVTYLFEDKFPTRRVVQIDRRAETLILRGDNIPGWPDFLVRREDVLGRAEVRARNGARVDRRSREWRWATRRALTIQRLLRLAHVSPWPLSAVLFRIVTSLRFR